MKLLQEAELVEFAKCVRESGEKIVLANGAFDLFHVGHLRYLEAAKSHADILIVAVNSDSSVKNQKGPTRPVVPESERAEIICGLRCVDAVHIFNEDTVRRLISLVLPNFHAKGTDYTAESVPEKDAIESVGGKTIIVGDPKNHSTSALLTTLDSSAKR